MSRTKRSFVGLLLAIPAALVICDLAGAGKPTPPPPTPIIATTTDRNFLEVDVNKVACQTEFDLAINVSGTGTHYRYKVGPAATTNPGVLTGYSSPITKTTPVSFNLTGQADGNYVLCLQGLELDKRGRIKNSQPLSEATAYFWTKDTAPVEFQVTFTGELEGANSTHIWAINNTGIAVGRADFYDEMGQLDFVHAIRWTLLGGLEDISTMDVPWFDLETDSFVDGWIFRGATDINDAGEIAGCGWDGICKRAVIFDGAMFVLLPRLPDPPYDEAEYFNPMINEYGEVQGHISLSGFPDKTFLWSPAAPDTMHIVEPYPMGIGANIFAIFNRSSDGALLLADLYQFHFDANGGLTHLATDTIAFTTHCQMFINEGASFAYMNDDGTTQSVSVYVPGQGSTTVRESTNAVLPSNYAGFRSNNSNDFVYNLDSVPYLYRYSENRSYRLYDLADSETKSALFASSNGTLKNSTKGIYYSVVSDDDVSGAPEANSFDTVSGKIHYDLTAGGTEAFVLTPIPRQ